MSRKGSIYSLMTNSESPNSLFHLEILNTDFLAKVWGYYLQSLQRLSTKVCKYFRPFESLQKTFLLKVFADFRGESICRLSWKVFADFGGNNYTYFRGESICRLSL